jgi:hypothetical protein
MPGQVTQVFQMQLHFKYLPLGCALIYCMPIAHLFLHLHSVSHSAYILSEFKEIVSLLKTHF